MKEGLVSRTAMLIAASQLQAKHDVVLSYYLEPEAISISTVVLQKSGVRGALLQGLIQSSAGGLILKFFEWLLLPGLPAHFVLRKHVIAQHVAQAISGDSNGDGGAARLIVVAAGFDALAYRTARTNGDLDVVEIDFPSTQVFKKTCLSALPPCANLQFCSADLSQQSMTSLFSKNQQPPNLPLDASQSTQGRSVIVIEGLTMYLPEAKVHQLLKDARILADNGGQVICTFMVPAPDQRIAFHNANPLVKHLLSLWREPFTWGATQTAFEALAQGMGYIKVEFFNTQDFATSIGYGKRVAVGEVIAKLTV
jgi:O-methyltransferase involved in polyketide biosynthesis